MLATTLRFNIESGQNVKSIRKFGKSQKLITPAKADTLTGGYRNPHERDASAIIDMIAAYILLAFFGTLGAHRFYLRKWVTAIIYLFTFGLFGLGVIWDIFMIPSMARELNGIKTRSN